MKKLVVILIILIHFVRLYAQQDYRQGVILLQVWPPESVKFSENQLIEGSTQLQSVFQRYPAIRVQKLSHINRETDGCYRIEFPVDYPLRTIRESFRNCPDIQYVNLAWRGIMNATPDDSLWSNQWALIKIKMSDAWDIIKPNDDILVGILDTGIDSTHEDLKDNIWTNPNEIPGNGIDDDGNGKVDDIQGWDWQNPLTVGNRIQCS